MPDHGPSEETRIQLCGRLSIELHGRELVGSLRGRQVPLLFAYLALNRERAIGREELAGALWPERAPASQDAALRTLLSRLRSGLGSDAVAGRDEISLALPEPVWIDVEAATAQLARASATLADGDPRAAWALAQVPLNIARRGLLPGVQASWLEPHRRELAELQLEALEVIGRAGLRLGGTQLASVQRAARSLIETEPYRESGYVLLMDALAAAGNVAEALRVYEQLRALLRDELGMTPSSEAIAAHERLLGGAGAGSAGGAATATITGEPPALLELPRALREVSQGAVIGRAEELGRLADWWSSSEAEPVMLIAGTAGVGKTTLLARLAAEVHGAGATVLAGHAPRETLVPYQPLLEAIGHFVREAPAATLRSVLRGSDGADLARLVPELGRRLPERSPAQPGDPETDRYRLFEAVAGMLGEVAALGPLLIVLDDLHWADRPTLLLLRHLARSPQARGLRILGAHRDEDWSDGFATALADLRREGLLRALELAGLGREDAIALVRMRAGGVPSEPFLAALYEETEGNPFFIAQLVRHLADAGVIASEAGPAEVRRAGLPDDVRELLARRTDRLSADGREWARAAAVIGREFDAALLEEVIAFGEDRSLEALEETLDAGLVTEEAGSPGRYAFTHALVREALLAGMSATRRGRMHQRVGRAIEARQAAGTGGDGFGEPAQGARLAALAHHFTQSGDPADAPRAIDYAVAAGAQATALLANEEAAEHYERALEVLARTDPGALARRCELLLLLGEARARSGERPASWPVLREAATLAARLGDHASLVRAAIGASRRWVQPPGVVDEELIALLDDAAAATAGQETVTRVRLLGRLCGSLYFSSRRAEMAPLAAEATAIAARLGDPEAVALAAAARRRAYWNPTHLERRIADATILLRAAREADDIELTMQGHAWLTVDLLEAGDRTAVEAQIEAFAQGARQLRQPLFIWVARTWQAMLTLLDGRLEDADRLAAEALTAGIQPEGITASQYYAVQLLGIRREQLRMAELEPATRELVRAQPERIAWRAGLVTLLADGGRTAEARAELAAVAAIGLTAIPQDGDWMTTVTLLADLAAELADRELGEQLYTLLAPHGELCAVIGMATVCLGPVARPLGRLALAAGERERAVAHLRRAVAVARQLDSPLQLGHAQVDLARALGDGPEAIGLLVEAARAAEERRLPLLARRARTARTELS